MKPMLSFQSSLHLDNITTCRDAAKTEETRRPSLKKGALGSGLLTVCCGPGSRQG